MCLFKFVGVIAITLIQEGTSQALPTQASATGFRDTASKYPELDLQRRLERRDLDDILSGTLTITIAPDATCGLYNRGSNTFACGRKPCSWESGLINRVFCDLQELATTCLDGTQECDSDCLSNGYKARCTDSLYPICDLAYFGDGIYAHRCAQGKAGISIDTTWGRKPQDLTTMVLVNRTKVSLLVDDGQDSDSTFESTATTETETETETTATEASQSASATKTPLNGPNVGAIVGGVVGGLAVIGVTIGFLGFLFLRRRRRPEDTPSNGPAHSNQQQPYTTETKGTAIGFDRLRQLIGGSSPPVELQGDTVSPATARAHEGSGIVN